ncbi:MAG: peptide chain release factor N(5)-glutamine methyltransferase [Firmicutes bacterium]|nr:peptide chain release factor N(5)-glutamine methyltransferase [Bacillota bacterium]
MKVPDIKWVLASTADFFAGKGMDAARLEAEVLLAHVLGTDRLHLYLMPDRPLDAEEIRKYKEAIRLRLLGTPTAYITGKKSFLKWEFKVTPEVLIPRPETELLVEKAVAMAAGRTGGEGPGTCRLLDLGTGSGAVAVALAHYLPECRIDAVDISPDAVAVAKENARVLGMEERITFYTGDLFSALPAEKKGGYLGVVSNPPYIPSKAWPALPREVRAEPRVALDGGEDGLKVIKDILHQAGEYLMPGGFVALEHGDDQHLQVTAIAKKEGFPYARTYKDLSGRCRVTVISRENE